MKATITVTNRNYTAEESFALAQHHGGDDGEGLPDQIQDAVNASPWKWEDIDSGDWILVCDGELKNIGYGANPVIVES